MNRERVRRLIKSGRMTKAGLAAIEHVAKKVEKVPAGSVKFSAPRPRYDEQGVHVAVFPDVERGAGPGS